MVENLLLPFEKTLPSTEIKFLVVNAALVKDPEAELQRMLTNAACRRRHQEDFDKFKKVESARLVAFLQGKKAGYLTRLGISVTPARLQMIAAQIVEETCDADAVCDLFGSLITHIKSWQQTIGDKCQVKIVFDETAIDHLLSLRPRSPQTIDDICQKLLQFLAYGLPLMRQKQAISELVIPATGVADPEKFINELVEKTYKV